MWRAGAALCCAGQASHCGGFSCCRGRSLDGRAQWLWSTGLTAPQHVGSSGTPDQSHVPCIGRWIPNHWATREAPLREILNKMLALITIAIPCVFADFGDSHLILSITPSPLLTTLASWVQSLLHDTAGPVSFSGVPRHHPPHPLSCLPRREIPESDGQGEPVSGKMRSVALAT